MESLIEFFINNGAELVAGLAIAGVSYVLGHVRGYIKRKADEPGKDVWDAVQAIVDAADKKKK